MNNQIATGSNKKIIEIFEPAMCCSTGLCGPNINSELLRVSTVVDTLAKKGVNITRYNLSGDPQEFVLNQFVNNLLVKDGVEILPITLVDNVVVKTKSYPTNNELTQWTGIPISESKPKQERHCKCCCHDDDCR